MHEHGCCLILQISDSLFGHPVLKVGIYAAVCNRLAALSDMVNETIVRKPAIVSVVVSDGYSPGLTVLFESHLPLYCLVGRELLLQVYVRQSAVVVNVHRSTPIALYRRHSFHVADEPERARFELIH